MINQDTIRKASEDMKAGDRRRAAHDCGPGETMLLTASPQGIRAYCFRCQETGMLKNFIPLAQRLEQMRQADSAEVVARGSVEPPGPCVWEPQEWPVHARLWLYKAGFSNDDIQRYGWYWNPRLQRVVLPTEGYWQARGFNPDRAKYINPQVDRSRLVAKFGTVGGLLFLTEDMLSAAKIAKAGFAAWSTLGVVLPLAVALEIEQLKVPVIVCLDPDEAGVRGGSRMARQLKLYGVNAHFAAMPTDPKFQTTEGIKKWTRDTLSSCSSLSPVPACSPFAGGLHEPGHDTAQAAQRSE